MATSDQPAEGAAALLHRVGHGRGRLLDVGAGDGRWGRLLRGRFAYAAGLDIQPADGFWEPGLYDEHIVADLRGWSPGPEPWDAAILGDVLEHLPQEEGRAAIARLAPACRELYLVLPVSLCPQGPVDGNPHEEHLAQWFEWELEEWGWLPLHVGPAPTGLVRVGTYWRPGGAA